MLRLKELNDLPQALQEELVNQTLRLLDTEVPLSELVGDQTLQLQREVFTNPSMNHLPKTRPCLWLIRQIAVVDTQLLYPTYRSLLPGTLDLVYDITTHIIYLIKSAPTITLATNVAVVFPSLGKGITHPSQN